MKKAHRKSNTLTKANTAVLQQVAEVVEHGFLVLTADSTEVTEEAAAIGHHFRKSDFLKKKRKKNDITVMHTTLFTHLVPKL